MSAANKAFERTRNRWFNRRGFAFSRLFTSVVTRRSTQRYTALLFLFIPSISMGLSLLPLPLQQRFQAATFVGVAEIEQGHIIYNATTNCGAKYRAKILLPLKGSYAVGDEIEFGYYIGNKIGSEYLLFLNTVRIEDNERFPLNPKLAPLCKQLWPKLHIGIASELEWPDKVDREEAFRFSRLTLLPPELRKTEVIESEQYSEQEYWVLKSDLVPYLKKIPGNR